MQKLDMQRLRAKAMRGQGQNCFLAQRSIAGRVSGEISLSDWSRLPHYVKPDRRGAGRGSRTESGDESANSQSGKRRASAHWLIKSANTPNLQRQYQQQPINGGELVKARRQREHAPRRSGG